MCQQGLNKGKYCHGSRSSSRGRALRLYLTCKLPYHLCVDGVDDEKIPDEEIAAAVAVGASVIEHLVHCIRHRCGLVWLMALLVQRKI